jgi:hypothetical protein
MSIQVQLYDYTFFWSPEGRKICTITAATRAKAFAMFREQERKYARYMGEVYFEVVPHKEMS